MPRETASPAHRFTEPLVERLIANTRLPRGQRDVVIADDAMPGFFLRIFAGGAAVYGVRFRVGRQQRRMSLGPVVEGGLKDARKAASQAINKAKLGEDVAAAKKAALRRRVTFGDLVPKYLDAREPQRTAIAAGDDRRRRSTLKARTWTECKRYLEHKSYWKPLHRLPIEAIGVEDIVKELNRIEEAHGASTADAAKRYVSGFFAWALDRLHVKANPALGIRGRASTTGRKRVLSETELAEVWRACGEDDQGRIVRLLILTGQRRGEIADLQWAEINTTEPQIELPPSRTKNGLAHLVPLSDEAAVVLAAAPCWQDRAHVFGSGALRGFQGWSKAKAELDARISGARKKDGNAEPMPHWTVHDIRRSFVTHMGERGFAEPHVIEAIVNHVSGAKGGVAGVYNKAQYHDERRKALKAWGAHVAKLVGAA
jgi:integrase